MDESITTVEHFMISVLPSLPYLQEVFLQQLPSQIIQLVRVRDNDAGGTEKTELKLFFAHFLHK